MEKFLIVGASIEKSSPDKIVDQAKPFIHTIDDALLKERMIGLVTNRKEQVAGKEKVLEDDLYHTGVVGYIHKLTKLEKGYYQVMVSGVKKMKIMLQK